MPSPPLIRYGRNGSSTSPNSSTEAATARYIHLYRFSSRASFCSSFRAAGSYILNTMAVPMPSSAKLRMLSTSVNRPLTPRYAAERQRMNTIRLIKDSSIVKNCPPMLTSILMIE